MHSPWVFIDSHCIQIGLNAVWFMIALSLNPLRILNEPSPQCDWIRSKSQLEPFRILTDLQVYSYWFTSIRRDICIYSWINSDWILSNSRWIPIAPTAFSLAFHWVLIEPKLIWMLFESGPNRHWIPFESSLNPLWIPPPPNPLWLLSESPLNRLWILPEFFLNPFWILWILLRSYLNTLLKTRWILT